MRRVRLIIALSLLVWLVSCQPEPAEFLNIDFSKWTRLNAEPITADIPGHGSGERNIYMNDIGKALAVRVVEGRASWEYPEGTTILKTVGGASETAEDGQTTMLLGMVKDSSHPQNLGGWLWLTRNPRTGEEVIFDFEYCVSCHADANERRKADDLVPTGLPNPNREFRDFVFYPYFGSD